MIAGCRRLFQLAVPAVSLIGSLQISCIGNDFSVRMTPDSLKPYGVMLDTDHGRQMKILTNAYETITFTNVGSGEVSLCFGELMGNYDAWWFYKKAFLITTDTTVSVSIGTNSVTLVASFRGVDVPRDGFRGDVLWARVERNESEKVYGYRYWCPLRSTESGAYKGVIPSVPNGDCGVAFVNRAMGAGDYDLLYQTRIHVASKSIKEINLLVDTNGISVAIDGQSVASPGMGSDEAETSDKTWSVPQALKN